MTKKAASTLKPSGIDDEESSIDAEAECIDDEESGIDAEAQ